MLITNQVTKMKWHPRNKKYYVNLGYEFTKIGEEFEVKVEDLTIGAKSIVKVKCDYCGKIIERKYQAHINQHSKDCGDVCGKCKTKKVKKSNMINYGVENVFELDDIKEKIKQGNLEKYGTEYYSSTQECREKVVRTCIERYGVKSYRQTEEYIKKATQTNLEKYGYNYYVQNPKSIEKIKQILIEKYNGIGTGSEITKEKIFSTIREKYGVEYATQNSIVKEKTKQTNIKKYGVPYVTQNPQIQKKIKDTCIKKYGAENPMQNPQVREKARQTLYENGSTPTSSQQLKIYDMLSSMYGICELNYPCGSCSLDCFVEVSGVKIDVEYDGWYWHKNHKEKDRRRDEFVKGQGFKVLRIKSKKRIPTKDQLKNSVDHLIKSNHKYIEIDLDI